MFSSRSSRSHGSHWRDEQGISTVLMSAVLGGVLILVGAIAIAVDIAHTKSRSSTAADMAALAGANEVLVGEPCAAAAAIAKTHSSELVECEIKGEDIQVSVEAPMQGALQAVLRGVRGGHPTVKAVSRAGPPQCDSQLISLGIPC